jgi:hypothetical protein
MSVPDVDVPAFVHIDIDVGIALVNIHLVVFDIGFAGLRFREIAVGFGGVGGCQFMLCGFIQFYRFRDGLSSPQLQNSPSRHWP